jgi:UrcA family protein
MRERSVAMSRFLKTMSVLPCVLAVAASPLTAVAMQAGPPPDEPLKRVVSYADLDLSRDSGVATLYSRINSAAREVCEPIDDWALRLQRFDCRQAAIARAIADANLPTLTSLYLTKSKTAAVHAQQ